MESIAVALFQVVGAYCSNKNTKKFYYRLCVQKVQNKKQEEKKNIYTHTATKIPLWKNTID